MSDIDAMQGRIMAALDRIGQGLDGLAAGPKEGDAPADDGAEAQSSADLAQQLEEAHAACAKQEARAEGAEAALSAAQKGGEDREATEAARVATLEKLDSELSALRDANRQLRDNNTALREANAAGVADPTLINKAMMAELDALRAARAADRAEMDVVLTELGQIAGGAEPDTGSAGDSPDSTKENA